MDCHRFNGLSIDQLVSGRPRRGGPLDLGGPSTLGAVLIGSRRIGQDEPDVPPVVVHGPPADLLAWLLGRDDGSGLQVPGGLATPPALPAWR